MNRLMNIGTPKNMDEFQLGTINIIGGEEEMVQERINEEILERIPEKVSEITYEVTRIPTRILKELKAKVDYEISSHRLALRKLHTNESLKNKKAVSEAEMVELAYEIEGFLSDETFDSITAFNKSTYGKRNVITYLLAKRKNRVTHDVTCIPTKLSMITPDIEYEIIKGDNMKKNEIHVEEIEDEYTGEIIEDVFVENPFKERTGKLTVRDLAILHQSGKLLIKDEVPKHNVEVYGPSYTSTLELASKAGEGFFEFFLKHKKEIVIDIPNYMKLPIDEIRRTSFDYSMSTNQLSKNFITDYKGDKEKFGAISWHSKDSNQYIAEKALSYNYVDYSQNSVIVVGPEESIDNALNEFKELNNVQNGYYDFNGNVGLNGLTKFEEDYLKSLKRKKAPRDNEEVKELLEICQEITDEEDLRFELRDLKTRTSSELFFLIQNIEEEAPGDIDTTVLLSVLTEMKGQKEIFEDEKDGLTVDIKDLITVEKTKVFKADRKYKNLYNQQKGVLLPNQNPQEMEYKPCVSLEELKPEIEYRKNLDNSMRNVLNRHIEKYGMRTFKDAKGNETKIRRDMTIIESEFFPSGGSCVSRQTAYSPKNNDISEEKYHHVSSKRITLVLTKEQRERATKIRKETKTPAPRPSYYETKIREYELNRFLNQFQEEKPWYEFLEETLWTPDLQSKAEEERINKGLTSKENKITRTTTGLENVMRDILPLTKPLQMLNIPDNGKGYVRYPKTFEQHREFIWTFLDYLEKEMQERPMEEVVHKNGKIKDSFFNEILRKEMMDLKGIRKIQNSEGEVYGVKIGGIKFFAEGNIDLLLEPTIGIAGTRKPSKETVKFIDEVVKEYKDHVIVSGLALGCDSLAHYAALRHGAKTIAVLPSGLDNISPKRNINLAKQIVKQGGLLLSEYEPEQGVIFKGGRNTYFERNRVIASISKTVLICEAGRGTMNTFNHAKKLGKEILVQMIDNPNNIKIVDNEDGDFLLI